LDVTVKDKVVTATVNGQPLYRAELRGVSPTGALSLRPEGEMDFANLFVRELK
jgi:hypothetical protein